MGSLRGALFIVRKLLTRFSQSDWLLDVLKISSDVRQNCLNEINNGSTC